MVAFQWLAAGVHRALPPRWVGSARPEDAASTSVESLLFCMDLLQKLTEGSKIM